MEERYKTMGETIHTTRTGPPFWTASFAIMCVLFICMALFIPDQPLEAKSVIFVVALMVLLAYPDMPAIYGTGGVMLKFGIGGMWKARIDIADITGVSITEFNGLTQFGGWGIHGGMGKFKGTMMWGMPVKGSRGIWISTSKGRKYLIPDPAPEETIEAIKLYYPVDANPAVK